MYYFKEDTQSILVTGEVLQLPIVPPEEVDNILFERDVNHKLISYENGVFVFKDSVVLPTTPPPSIFDPVEIERNARNIRDSFISDHADLLDRHRNQKDFGIPTSITEEEASNIAHYIEHLRNLPDHPDWPNMSIPLREEWNASNKG